MTLKKALKILGLQEAASTEEIKKRYRSLMMIAHPDVLETEKMQNTGNFQKNTSVDARDLNLAYEYLMKYQGQPEITTKTSARHKNDIRWNAPINDSAYRSRDIFHSVEDADGVILGEAVLDTGKYYWTEDEEFSLFLKSLYHCGKDIINEYAQWKKVDFSTEDEMKILPEIVYLLSQQYVDTQMVLSAYANVIAEGELYQIDAMLETHGARSLKAGVLLQPSALRNHRLYVSNEKGQELGYISFKDDRLYYGIIPLFERKAVQVKIQVQGEREKRIKTNRYREINLMIKMKAEDQNAIMESISTKINRLLESVDCVL